jgi:hypothetical protein
MIFVRIESVRAARQSVWFLVVGNFVQEFPTAGELWSLQAEELRRIRRGWKLKPPLTIA